jgi:hypothetical protein
MAALPGLDHSFDTVEVAVVVQDAIDGSALDKRGP